MLRGLTPAELYFSPNPCDRREQAEPVRPERIMDMKRSDGGHATGLFGQPGLFGDVPAEPDGFVYHPDFLTAAQEQELLEQILNRHFGQVQMRGVVARRRTVQYGMDYESATFSGVKKSSCLGSLTAERLFDYNTVIRLLPTSQRTLLTVYLTLPFSCTACHPHTAAFVRRERSSWRPLPQPPPPPFTRPLASPA